jgi:NACalpha-BTF3-like transcription factor
MLSDYKCTMQNLHYAKRSDEILENEDDQMLKFCQEAGLSLEQLHGQSKIQMAYAPKAWVVAEPMVDEKRFHNNAQTRIFRP